jgi:ferrochelatase
MVKVRTFHDHPGFVEPLVEGLRRILSEADSADTVVLMTAHSIPESSAAGCDYRAQLEETAGLVASGAGLSPGSWRLVYQSRSGVPGQPWLGPDVVEAIDNLPAGTGTVLVAPIGFVSDHMEVVFDLDTQARQAAEERGLRFLRAPTPGVHPRFVQMVRELVEELEDPPGPALALGAAGPRPVPCRAGCCPAPQRHPSGPGR